MHSPDSGRVVSLHLHPAKAGEPCTSVNAVLLVADRGIQDEPRYFKKLSFGGKPSRRQLSLIEREIIARHCDTLGHPLLAPGAVRSNIETSGIELSALIGMEVFLGESVVRFYAPRTPCEQMDRLIPGLRGLMENSRQGVLATIVQGGWVRCGDLIQPRY